MVPALRSTPIGLTRIAASTVPMIIARTAVTAASLIVAQKAVRTSPPASPKGLKSKSAFISYLLSPAQPPWSCGAGAPHDHGAGRSGAALRRGLGGVERQAGLAEPLVP